MNALTKIATRSESILQSLKRTIKALPVTQQIALVQYIVEASDFAPFADYDYRVTDRLDDALTELMRQSIAADFAEDAALHGVAAAA